MKASRATRRSLVNLSAYWAWSWTFFAFCSLGGRPFSSSSLMADFCEATPLSMMEKSPFERSLLRRAIGYWAAKSGSNWSKNPRNSSLIFRSNSSSTKNPSNSILLLLLLLTLTLLLVLLCCRRPSLTATKTKRKKKTRRRSQHINHQSREKTATTHQTSIRTEEDNHNTSIINQETRRQPQHIKPQSGQKKTTTTHQPSIKTGEDNHNTSTINQETRRQPQHINHQSRQRETTTRHQSSIRREEDNHNTSIKKRRECPQRERWKTRPL